MSLFGGITGILGTIGGIYTGNQAASAERAATNAAIARLGQAKGEAIGYQQPYYDIGQQALSPLTSLLLGQSYDPETGEFTNISDSQRLNNFFTSPNYQFTLSEGLRAVEASKAARGGLYSGGTLKAVNDYAQGQASGEYNNYINQLFNMAGIGQNAANNMSNIATGIGSSQADYTYQGGMANANKYANLSNFSYGVGGMGFSSALGNNGNSGSSGTGNNSTGTYNSSYGQMVGLNNLGF